MITTTPALGRSLVKALAALAELHLVPADVEEWRRRDPSEHDSAMIDQAAHEAETKCSAAFEQACHDLIAELLKHITANARLARDVHPDRVGSHQLLLIGNGASGYYLGANNDWFEELHPGAQRRTRKPTQKDWLLFLSYYLPQFMGVTKP